MSGNVLLLLPMILPFIFGLIIGFQKEEKQRNTLVFIAMAIEALTNLLPINALFIFAPRFQTLYAYCFIGFALFHM